MAIEQSTEHSRDSRLLAHACCNDTYVRGHAHTFSVGTGPVARFAGPQYSATVSQNQRRVVPMPRVDEAMCGFSRIGGKFRGAGEAVEISQAQDASGANRWQLVVSAGNDGYDPKASNYRSLASKIKGTGADCFFGSIIVDNNGVQLFKDVNAGVPGVKLYGPDGVAETTIAVSPAARAMLSISAHRRRPTPCPR